MVELQLSDANIPPDGKGQGVNTARVWARYDGGPWVITPYRSLHKAKRFIDDQASGIRAFKTFIEEEE